ncbi:Vesicle transport protein, partial [Perkinsus olseni]
MVTPEGKRPRWLACLLGMLRGSRWRLHAVEARLTDDDVTFNSGAKQQKRVSRTRRFNTRATQTDESTVGGGGGRRLSVAVPVPWAGDLPTTPMSLRRQRTPSGSSCGENREGAGKAGSSVSSGPELLQGTRYHVVFLGDTDSVSDSSSSSSALSSISSFQSSTREGDAEEAVVATAAAAGDDTSRSGCAPPEVVPEDVAALQRRRLREHEAQTRALMHRWRAYVRGGAVHDVDRIISMRIESPCGLRRGVTSSLALSAKADWHPVYRGGIAFVVMSQHPPHSSALLGLEDPDSLVPGLLRLNLGGGDTQEKEVEASGPEVGTDLPEGTPEFVPKP